MKVTAGEIKRVKEEAFDKTSSVLSAMASPVRLRIVQLLSNGPKSVEEMANTLDQKVGNISQHLQKMAKESLVLSNKEGTKRVYSLKTPQVLKVWMALQNLSEEVSLDLKKQTEVLCPPELCSEKSFSQILKEIKDKTSHLIDVRPQYEYEFGSSKYARSVPVESFKKEMKNFNKKETYYLMCRGRYCSMANNAVLIMRNAGFDCYRLAFSFYEFRKSSVYK